MIVYLEQDENGDLILPLSDEFCAEAGWKVGDSIEWIDNGDGSWSLKKMEKELVLVECVSTFRMRYVVEVPKGKSEWALDTVACNEAEELSQEHLGEQIVSHRVIDEAEYLRVFDEDNAYLAGWPSNMKTRMIHRWSDEDPVEHSGFWYDPERNK